MTHNVLYVAQHYMILKSRPATSSSKLSLGTNAGILEDGTDFGQLFQLGFLPVR